MNNVRGFLHLLLLIICAQVFIIIGLDSIVDTTGTLISLAPFFAPDSEPHDKCR